MATTAPRATDVIVARPLPPGVRRLVLIIGIATALQGAWAYLWPRNFYAEFPVPAAGWVSTLGPFNDHLGRDFGSALFGLGFIACWAARSNSGVTVRTVMIGYVVFGVPHLIYHLTTFGEFSAASISIQIAALVLFIGIPLRVLAVMGGNQHRKGTAT